METEREAILDIAQARRGGGPLVVMPFGKMVPEESFMSASFELHDENWFLARPRDMLAHPKPDLEYLWPNGEDEGTLGRIRSGLYTRVKISELKQDTSARITHKGTNKEDVRWYKHILVSMTKTDFKRVYSGHEARAVQSLMSHGEQFREGVQKASGGLATAAVERGVV